jgi:integrase/recombinase XerD
VNRERALSKSELPIPILNGQTSELVESNVRKFLFLIPAIYDSWLGRRTSSHTRRSYDQDVMTFVRKYLRLHWPDDALKLLHVSVQTVQNYRDWLVLRDAAPKTINRRISSLSGFYKYLAASAAELRLPIVVPNPAHSQFIPRLSSDPIDETKALTVSRARQLIAMPSGDSVLDHRDRAILKFYVFTGARLAAGCHLNVSDFQSDETGATIRLCEKGDRRRTIGLHVAASQAIQEYLDAVQITSGSLFRSQKNSRSEDLGEHGLKPLAMYRILLRYLHRLPNSMREVAKLDGSKSRECIYSPHSLRATTATLLLDSGVDLVKVQELLGHRHVTTTQIYDKRRRHVSDGASHEVPI